MQRDKRYLYGWDGGDGEYVGDFATPEEAAEDVFVGAAAPGDTVTIDYGVPVDPLLLLAHGMPTVDGVLEAINEFAFDDVGHAADLFPDVSTEAELDLARKLRAAVMCWGREHGVEARFWRLVGTLTLTRTEDGWEVREAGGGQHG